jgi:disulfide oxidoreductase YuzD
MMVNQEFGMVKTALFTKVYENLGPVVSVKFMKNPHKKHYIMVVHQGTANINEVYYQAISMDDVYEMLMICLVDRDAVITEQKNNLQYIIDQGDEVVLRNALEPIVYKFLAKILERVASDQQDPLTPTLNETLQSAFDETQTKKKTRTVTV